MSDDIVAVLEGDLVQYSHGNIDYRYVMSSHLSEYLINSLS